MSFRCTNAFWFAGRVYPGGSLVEDHDPILETHRAYFAEVGAPASPSGETSSSDMPRVPEIASEPPATTQTEAAKPARRRTARTKADDA